MKPLKKKLQQAATSLLILPFLVTISGNASADPATSGGTNIEMSGPVTGKDNNVAETRNWDWHENPQAYLPDGLSDYAGDFAAAEPNLSRSDAVEKANADGAMGYRAEMAGAR